MKSLVLTTSLALTALGNAWATTADVVEDGITESLPIARPYEPVDGFRIFGSPDNWRALDRDTLIIWATPSKPYLVELMRPSPSLRFSGTIGVTSTVGRVTKFDSVFVDGWEFPIKAIYKLDREQARELRQPQTVRQDS